jgi:hypothetical protein
LEMQTGFSASCFSLKFPSFLFPFSVNGPWFVFETPGEGN